MKRTGSRQRARESIVRMIAKIQKLEAARHSGQPGIIERLKGMVGAALRTQQGVESNRKYSRADDFAEHGLRANFLGKNCPSY